MTAADGHILSGSFLKTGEEEITPAPARICVGPGISHLREHIWRNNSPTGACLEKGIKNETMGLKKKI